MSDDKSPPQKATGQQNTTVMATRLLGDNGDNVDQAGAIIKLEQTDRAISVKSESQLDQLHQQCAVLLNEQHQQQHLHHHQQRHHQEQKMSTMPIGASRLITSSNLDKSGNETISNDSNNNLDGGTGNQLTPTGGGNNNSSSNNNGGGNATNGRSKRLRTSFKSNQLKEMKRWFGKNQNPDAKDLKTLAQTTGLSKRVLQVSVRVLDSL